MALEHSRRTQRRREAGPRKGDLREAAILDATEELLETVRYADLTMDDIAKRAGTSRSGLYFYFASKEAVLAALHERTHAVMSAPVDVLRAGRGSTTESMRAAVALTGRIWREHSRGMCTFHEVASSSPEFGERWRANLEEHVEFLTELIETERTAGRATDGPPDPRSIASAWFWMLEQQFYDLHRRRHTRADETRLVDTLTTLWFRCIGSGTVGS